MAADHADVVVVGGGILGLATADALQTRLSGVSVVVLEKEDEVASHQTGRNSGVIHAGLYYVPGSLKAKLAVDGGHRMVEFCGEHGIAHDRCGKLVVATETDEIPQLAALAERARANAVPITQMGPEEARSYEPHVSCLAALHVASTGRADFVAVAQVLARRVVEAGGAVRNGTRAGRATPTPSGWRIDTGSTPVEASFLVGCAGLHADRVARASGERPEARILPFRGEYLDVVGPSADLIRGLVYPVPDPRFPFLGVHLTRGLDHRVHAGPNAVLALAREGYSWSDISARDLAGTAFWPGTARLLAKYWRPGFDELRRSLSHRRFVTSARRLVPDLNPADLRRAPAGVRAQAVDRRGALLDDFALIDGDRSLHLLNAPSPAATASLEIGALIANRVAKTIS
ncbi:MAG: L-2-hydroxyglutarate oxidase [Acidimicrobiaceae bacterium]|nr:L-2-hydroxyglutarate oxidase [Acidimicrobiaceae bacterium]|tara:strand:+ start:2300 stop:3505 length:1206 start_codon:yes stop_codon:yes gene_type:complete